MRDADAILRVRLDADTKAILQRVSAERGMTQTSVVTRLVKWFARQDSMIQGGVVSGMSDEVVAKLVRIWLRRGKIAENPKDSRA